jgi:aryl-alcohol dehydrogenase-like predicted oxidoreductase
MQQIQLGANEGLQLSQIAFGTASLHHLHTRAERERLILTALGHGITHFDTSPFYGQGIGERSLAVLASSNRRSSIATKVGLYPPGGSDAGRGHMIVRKVLGRILPRLSKPLVDLSVARARQSLLDSLRRMRRERIDLLLLHEPRIELLATDEWLRWLDSERDRIGAVGVAGEIARVLPLVLARSPFAAIIQTRDSVVGNEAITLRQAGHVPQITFGHLANRDRTLSISQTLQRAVERSPQTVLLVSTRREERVREFVRCIDRLSLPSATSAATSCC